MGRYDSRVLLDVLCDVLIRGIGGVYSFVWYWGLNVREHVMASAQLA